MNYVPRSGAVARNQRALRQLADALDDTARASDEFAAHLNAAARTAVARSRAIRRSARAYLAVGKTVKDDREAERLMRQAELGEIHARQSDDEASAERARAAASSAEARRARAQAAVFADATRPLQKSASTKRPTNPGARGGRRAG
jgi:hypothetical protein